MISDSEYKIAGTIGRRGQPLRLVGEERFDRAAARA
jgi:hypothetical protein